MKCIRERRNRLHPILELEQRCTVDEQRGRLDGGPAHPGDPSARDEQLTPHAIRGVECESAFDKGRRLLQPPRESRKPRRFAQHASLFGCFGEEFCRPRQEGGAGDRGHALRRGDQLRRSLVVGSNRRLGSVERTALPEREHLGYRPMNVAQRRVIDRADDRSANQRMPEGHPPGRERDHPHDLCRLEVGERDAEPCCRCLEHADAVFLEEGSEREGCPGGRRKPRGGLCEGGLDECAGDEHRWEGLTTLPLLVAESMGELQQRERVAVGRIQDRRPGSPVDRHSCPLEDRHR